MLDRSRHCFIVLLFVAATSVAGAQTISTLSVDGATLSYREYGKGDPLIIVGGLAGTSSDYLVPMASELGKRYRTFLIDMRGTGGSTISRLDTSNVGLRRVAEDVEALRRHLKVTQWVVVGHAFGGSAALAAAALYPQTVRGLLLIGPNGLDPRSQDSYYANIRARMTHEDSVLFNEWRHIGPWSPQRPKARLEQFRATLGGTVSERRVLPEIRAAITERTYVAAVADVYWNAYAGQSATLHGLLRSFKGPAVIIQGDRDPVDRRTADRIRSALSASKFKEIRSSGAFPWLEKPKDFWSAANLFLKNLRK